MAHRAAISHSVAAPHSSPNTSLPHHADPPPHPTLATYSQSTSVKTYMQCMMHWTGAGKVVGPGKAMGHFGSHNQLNKLSDKWKEPKEAQEPDVNGGGTKATKPTMFCHHPHGKTSSHGET